MSWSQHLRGSQAIADDDVGNILDGINAGGSLAYANWRRQELTPGDVTWHTECDIWRWKGEILFRGAYFSGDTGLPQRFEVEARRRGFDVALGLRQF